MLIGQKKQINVSKLLVYCSFTFMWALYRCQFHWNEMIQTHNSAATPLTHGHMLTDSAVTHGLISSPAVTVWNGFNSSYIAKFKFSKVVSIFNCIQIQKITFPLYHCYSMLSEWFLTVQSDKTNVYFNHYLTGFWAHYSFIDDLLVFYALWWCQLVYVTIVLMGTGLFCWKYALWSFLGSPCKDD